MASESSAEQASGSSYDLIPKLLPNLDAHLIFPLLEFAAGLYEEEGDDAKVQEALKAKYELLKGSNMTDYVAGLYCDLHGLDNPPAEFTKQRDQVLAKMAQYDSETARITDLLADDEVISNLRSDKVANLEFLKKEHGVTIEMVNALFDFGNFQYSCGNYGAAAETLYRFRVLSTDNDKVAAANWGKFACELLTTNWDTAIEELTKIKEQIDTKLFNNPLAQLKHRTWLIHWALFPLFNHEAARDTILETFFSPAYINTIQTNCPYILRYIVAAVITSRGKPTRNTGTQQKQLKDVVRIVRQEAYEYSDPITEFVKALYIDFDFEEAQKQLTLADEVLRNDFFLSGSADAFVEAARHLISESYCKIHHRIVIQDLSARLGLTEEEGEKWIVNLIKDTRVDAKIDYKEGTVVMNHPPSSVYQQVIERTKGGFFRTQVLTAAVTK
ncbi:hypothetical protein MKZ38_007086 [Zalerion maritima]|uniref:Eukaryotic translation initiation factor 3 subunit E n=1 Tax=Zalerion maritima TaxID=339359 RepID=A0AAD5WPZ8_9PEZI|nr:hypothetical protein MKZ38_007086 [Zalerion maritima]